MKPKKIIYSDDKVRFEINLSQTVDELTYIDWTDSRPREKILCRNCNSFGIEKRKLISFNDRVHNLSIKSYTDDNLIDEKSIQFLVDSTIPKITKLEPRRGFSNGNFNIEFREENPRQLTLFYNENKNVSIDLLKCISEEDEYSCEDKINFSDFENQSLNYWFELTDITGNSVTSRENKIKIDTIPPRLNSFNYSINKRKVNFVFNITELNFDEITYVDNSEKRPRERRLCSRLKNEICETSESFKSGVHDLTIFIKDEAGNSITEKISFQI